MNVDDEGEHEEGGEDVDDEGGEGYAKDDGGEVKHDWFDSGNVDDDRCHLLYCQTDDDLQHSRWVDAGYDRADVDLPSEPPAQVIEHLALLPLGHVPDLFVLVCQPKVRYKKTRRGRPR